MALVKVKITPKPHVLITLRGAFPDRAQVALSTYVQRLEQLIEDQILIGRSREAFFYKGYDLPVKKLADSSGQIPLGNGRKIRTHTWLKRHQIALFEKKEVGSNISEKISVIKILEENADILVENKFEDITNLSSYKLTRFLKYPPAADVKEINDLFDKFDSMPADLFDISPINIHTLEKFIRRLIAGKVKLNKLESEHNFYHALWLLRVGQIRNGQLLQLKNPSAFGRTYYKHMSVQNISKVIRPHMLGDSWEYDIKSSVISWRVSKILEMSGLRITSYKFTKAFPTTRTYLKDKNKFYKSIRNQVFLHSSFLEGTQQDQMIKDSFTAMNFGAQLNDNSWWEFGEEHHCSIREIFSVADNQEWQRFLNCPQVTEFIEEQKIISKQFKENLSVTDPDVFNVPFLMNPNGGPIMNKVLAYLYQRAETMMMDIVRSELAGMGRNILANIHDAIVIRDQLTSSELDQI
jgi:hypothetical protein